MKVKVGDTIKFNGKNGRETIVSHSLLRTLRDNQESYTIIKRKDEKTMAEEIERVRSTF